MNQTLLLTLYRSHYTFNWFILILQTLLSSQWKIFSSFFFFFPEDFMLSCKVLLLTSFNFFFFLRSQVADPFQLEVNRMILVSGSLPHLTDIQSDTAEGFWVVWQSPFHVTEDALHLLWGLQTHFLYFFSLSPLIQTVLFLIVINSVI